MICFQQKQDGVLDKNTTMDNVQKHNTCTNDRTWQFLAIG
jgi:hypothetical protein